MKPCSRNRKLIAWLALDALDPRQTQDLRTHLESCEKCRRYLEEISNVTEKLAAADARSDVQASVGFYHKVVGRVRAEESPSIGEILAAPFRATWLSWCVALPVIGATAVVIAALFFLVPRPGVPSPARSGVQAVLASGMEKDLQPTIASYQMIANRSLDQLDELLTRQGNRTAWSAPVYTASTLRPENIAD